jgi:hypothetical protein
MKFKTLNGLTLINKAGNTSRLFLAAAGMAAFTASVAAGQTPPTETPAGMAGTNNKPAAASAPSTGLKDAYAGKFLVGGACDFEIFKHHAGAVERVTFWGINDRRSWRANQRPLLFDPQMNPKPAYQAILDVAQGKSITNQP